MVLHFSESIEMEISLETVKRALEILEDAERYMHLALQVGCKNPFSNTARNITRFFVARNNEPASFATLLEQFYAEARTSEDRKSVV